MRRLIPARAGKTLSRKHGLLCTRAHPRAGGENFEGGELAACSGGSSPRGRGKLLWSTVESGVKRLIPARAGKTTASSWMRTASSAHPRAGGENTVHILDTLEASGSSPRGRGKPEGTRGRFLVAGLIPARAGKTAARDARALRHGAHPRAGGENQISRSDSPKTTGSSPRGRGKPPPSWARPCRAGLIPARAGKTSNLTSWKGPAEAHPRAGGENQDENIVNLSKQGSSPRGRGKHPRRRERRRRVGLIPARAGKTGP